MNFQHFLLTRFNVGLQNTTYDYDEWMQGRRLLFENITLPSIINQTEQRFSWLIFIDSQTPEKYLKYFREYPAQIIPMDSSAIPPGTRDRQGVCPLAPSAAVEIRKRLHNANLVLTSRCDIDDGLKEDFFETIYRQKIQPGQCIVFKQYFIFDITDPTKPRIYQKNYAGNMFPTLCEAPENLRTVWVKQHYKMIKKFNALELEGFGGCQTIHQKNLSNPRPNPSAPWLELPAKYLDVIKTKYHVNFDFIKQGAGTV